MNDVLGPRGVVTVVVTKPDGTQYASNHNIITAQGDGLIADMFLTPPTKTRFDNAHSYIVVGTGFSGVSVPKNQTWVAVQTGTPQPMASGFPQLAGAFPNASLTYSVFFPAGSLISLT